MTKKNATEFETAELTQSTQTESADAINAIKQRISVALNYAISTGLFDQPLDPQLKDLISNFGVQLEEVANVESEVQNLYEQLMTMFAKLFTNKLKIVSAKYLSTDRKATVQEKINSIANSELGWEEILNRLMRLLSDSQANVDLINALLSTEILETDFAFVNSLVPNQFKIDEDLYIAMRSIRDLPPELQLKLMGLV